MKLLFSVIASEIMEVIVQVVAEVFKTIIDRIWKDLSTILIERQIRDQNFYLMK